MADATDPTSLPGLELARLVHTREVSRLEVPAAHVDHVERRNAGVSAVVERREAVDDLDLVELNEAFASQSLAVVRERGA